jgi:tetratricopeptide (TPR) repeat protein
VPRQWASLLLLTGWLVLSGAAEAQGLDCKITQNQGQAACHDIINNGPTREQIDAIGAVARQPLEQRTHEQEAEIAKLRESLGVNEKTLFAFFLIIDGKDVPAEQRPQRLVEIAGRYKALLAQSGSAPGDDPAVARLKDEAKAALDAGDLDRADALLAEAQAAEDADLDRRQRAAAATAAQRAQIALTQLRYKDAAAQFAAAAARLPDDDDEARGYLVQEAHALYRQGGEFGDNAALVQAIEGFRHQLDLYSRGTSPDGWAMTQTDLGTALGVLGERESGTARLEEAVAAFRAALLEWTRERVPLDWAGTQNNLGTALASLGERESGTARLEEAVAAFRDALLEYTRERVPLDWAMTQNNLGNALAALGERESGTTRLEEAVAA